MPWGSSLCFRSADLRGCPLATLLTNFHLHDTYFVVAHFHYVMFGGTMFMFLGGHSLLVAEDHRPDVQRYAGQAWVPADLRRLQPRRSSRSLSWVARHAAAVRRLWAELQPYHVMSTSGRSSSCGVLLVAAYLIHSLFKGKKAPANPWGGDPGMELRLAAAARQLPRARRASASLTTTRDWNGMKHTEGFERKEKYEDSMLRSSEW